MLTDFQCKLRCRNECQVEYVTHTPRCVLMRPKHRKKAAEKQKKKKTVKISLCIGKVCTYVCTFVLAFLVRSLFKWRLKSHKQTEKQGKSFPVKLVRRIHLTKSCGSNWKISLEEKCMPLRSLCFPFPMPFFYASLFFWVILAISKKKAIYAFRLCVCMLLDFAACLMPAA